MFQRAKLQDSFFFFSEKRGKSKQNQVKEKNGLHERRFCLHKWLIILHPLPFALLFM